MSHKCVVCQTESTIKQLEFKNKQLMETINRLESKYDKMTITNDERQLIQNFEYSEKPVFGESSNVKDYQFITLTYDPLKFGYTNSEKSQREYLMAKIYNYVHFRPFYGCYEHHKNGNVHMHFILKESEEECKKMRKEIRRFFTDRINNKQFLDIGIAKDKTAIRYINKEEELKKQWFYSQYVNDTLIRLEDEQFIEPNELKRGDVQVTKPVNGGTQVFRTEFKTQVLNVQGEGSHSLYSLNNWVKKHIEIYNFIKKYLG